MDSVGGNQYLAELVNTVPSSSNIKYYANIVQKKSVLRSLIEADSISEIAFEDGEEHMDDVLDLAEKEFSR